MQFLVMINSLYMLHFLTTSFSFFSSLIQYIVYRLWKSNTQVIKKAIFCHGQFILHSCPFQMVYISHGGMSMLQVKIKFRSTFFKPTLILYFLSLLALIIHELGLGDKGKWESTPPPGGGTLGICGWGCATGTLEPLTYTRASSVEFCYPILE